jgi:hypothetical protein
MHMLPKRSDCRETDDLEAAPLEIAADTSDSTDEPALRELAEAMQSLQALTEQRGLFPVFPELRNEEIVALVQSQRMDKADSNEDEEDDHKACQITIAESVSNAEQLESFAFASPGFFCAEQMLALVNMRRELQRK